jgi:hypothetical protein
MEGPFSILKVDTHVTKTSAGAYILSRDGKAAHYVGRSDTDVASRIKSSAREEPSYIYFWFDYATSPMEAYYLECEWWHKYAPRDNDNHPAVPPGTSWKCPVPGCPWS